MNIHVAPKHLEPGARGFYNAEVILSNVVISYSYHIAKVGSPGTEEDLQVLDIPLWPLVLHQKSFLSQISWFIAKWQISQRVSNQKCWRWPRFLLRSVQYFTIMSFNKLRWISHTADASKALVFSPPPWWSSSMISHSTFPAITFLQSSRFWRA